MEKFNEYGMWPIRLALASVFIFHGYLKLFGGNFPADVAGFFDGLGIPLPYAFAVIVSLLEFFGGIALLLGLFTRYVSVLLAIVMLVAIFTVHLPQGFVVPGVEFPLMNLAALLTLAIHGAGKWSLDEKLFKKK